jgi:predicted RNase H-like HicB family nuclease
VPAEKRGDSSGDLRRVPRSEQDRCSEDGTGATITIVTASDEVLVTFRVRQPFPSVLRYGVVMEFTAVFKKVPEGYIAFVEELPGANTQGDTLDEARENLREAVDLVLEANRTIARQAMPDEDVIRERFRIAFG